MHTQEADLKNFKEFVSRKRPELIVVGAESRESLSIIDEFRECLTELEQEEDVGVVPVELLDPTVARIYSKTSRAKVTHMYRFNCVLKAVKFCQYNNMCVVYA